MGLRIWLSHVSVNGMLIKPLRNIVINYLFVSHNKGIIAQCITILNRVRIGWWMGLNSNYVRPLCCENLFAKTGRDYFWTDHESSCKPMSLWITQKKRSNMCRWQKGNRVQKNCGNRSDWFEWLWWNRFIWVTSILIQPKPNLVKKNICQST